MTIPTNISYSTNSCRLSVRCTCDNLDVIDITLNKKRGNYRWRKKSDGDDPILDPYAP
jgi:transcription initiation factor TFIID subunit TAF12